MKYTKVHLYDGPKPQYSQLTGVPCEFAWLEPKTMKQLHLPVICKDYLQDAIWSEHTKQSVGIYGFSWTPGKMSLTSRVYAMSVKLTKGEEKKADNMVALINHFDEACGFTKTTLLHDKDDKHMFALVLDKEWAKQPVRISLLTLLVRIGTAFDPREDPEKFLDAVSNLTRDTMYSYDRSMVERALPRIKKVLKEGFWPKQEYGDFDARTIHGMSGIVNSDRKAWQ